MTARVSYYKDVAYDRDYSHDISAQTDLLKRITLASVPFLGLWTPLRLPVSLAMGSLRAWNAQTNIDRILSISSVVSAFFKHRIGEIFTTLHDMTIEAKNLQTCNNWENASQSLIKILSSSLHLVLITQGGLELSVLAFILQGTVNLFNCKNEFKQGRWIESCANLLMAIIRLKQTYAQCKQLKRNWEIDAAIKRCYVNKLHEKWQFPSDHLPIGIETNGIRMISWNILNNAFMGYITDHDTQGLNRSLISDLNVQIGPSGLTNRDILITDMIKTMMSKSQVIALQECGQPFLLHLEQQLPGGWELIKSFSGPQKDQEIILYHKDYLTYQPNCSQTSLTSYPSAPNRPLQSAFFATAKGKNFQIINCHIPGDPLKPARQEFASYVHKSYQNGSITVALGDNNFERKEMIDAYRQAGFTDFSIHSPWKTNIDPTTKESKGIDHVFVIGTENSRDLGTQEIFTDDTSLRDTIDLLNKPYQDV